MGSAGLRGGLSLHSAKAERGGARTVCATPCPTGPYRQPGSACATYFLRVTKRLS